MLDGLLGLLRVTMGRMGTGKSDAAKDKPYLLSFRGLIAALRLGDIHKIGIRDLLWLTLVAALWIGWTVDQDTDYQQVKLETFGTIKELNERIAKLEDEVSRLRAIKFPRPQAGEISN